MVSKAPLYFLFFRVFESLNPKYILDIIESAFILLHTALSLSLSSPFLFRPGPGTEKDEKEEEDEEEDEALRNHRASSSSSLLLLFGFGVIAFGALSKTLP